MDEKNRLSQELTESQEQLDIAQKQLATRQEEREKVETLLRQQRRLLTEVETRQVQHKAHQRELMTRAETQQSTVNSLVSGIEQGKAAFDNLVRAKREGFVQPGCNQNGIG